jgi:Cupin-like domain
VEVRRAGDLPYADFVRDYVVPRRPLVIQDAVGAWPAMSRWTPEFFKTRFSQRRVKVSYDESMPFADFIDGVLASSYEQPGPYMYRLFLHEELPEVLTDLVPQNPYAFPGRYTSPLMFEYYRRPDGYLKLLIGGVGGRFPIMHYDGDDSHAAITEIYGDKEFILYSPDDGPYLYPSPLRANHSIVDDPHEQDLERFPLLAKASQFRTVLKPGDTVYVPAGWWHTARVLTPSISVCQNMVFSTNWKTFVDLTTAPDLGRTPTRQAVKRVYLRGAGHVMSAMEWLQGRYPGIARTLALPGRIAPISSSAMAHDPGTRPLTVRTPTG